MAATRQVTYGIAQAALILGRTEQFVATQIAQGTLPLEEGGGVNRAALLAFLARHDPHRLALIELSQAVLDDGWYDTTPERLRALGIVSGAAAEEGDGDAP